MRFGVIGCSRMGLALGAALQRGGHDVFFGSRNPERLEASLRSGSYAEAAGFGEVLILATLWEATHAALIAAGPLDGKVLLTCVNPETSEEPLVVGHTSSAAEMIQAWALDARVVEAFNGIYAEAVDLAPDRAPEQTVVFCGDDASARGTVRTLIRELGFDALDAGPLRNARYLEPLAQLVVYLVRKAGYGPLGIHQRWMRNETGSESS